MAGPQRPAYSRLAWSYIALIVGSGIVVQAWLIGRTWPIPPAGGTSIALSGAIFLLATLAGLFPVKIGPATKMNSGTAVVFAGVLLLPLALPGLIAAGAVAVYSSVLRRPWFNVLFSAGQHALTASVAAIAYQAWWSPARPPLVSPAAAISALAAAIAYVATSTFVLAGVIASTQRRAYAATWLNLVAQSGAQYLALVSVGAVAAVGLWFAPFAIALPVFVLPLIRQVDRGAEQILASKEEVERVLARQRQFVSNIAHEVGTPLTTISGNLTVLRQGSGDDVGETREILSDVEAEFQRLSGIFSRLMLLAQADEDDSLVRRPIALDQLVAEVGAAWTPTASRADLTFELGAVAPVQVSGDDGRIRLAIGELLENARRHTPSGGRVTLGLQPNGRSASIVVRDTGVGIREADLPRIFDRFYQGREVGLPERSGSRAGSGLGLAIVKWVAESHGGRVRVESALGSGSTFTVELPIDERASGSDV